MAHRRCLHTLRRHAADILSLKPPPSLPLSTPISLKTLTPFQHKSYISSKPGPTRWSHYRHFSSNKSDDEDGDEVVDEDEETDDESSEGEDIDDSVPDLEREYTVEETEAEAADIGYKVEGPLLKSDRVIKKYEPVFAVVQIGSHQFKLILNKVLILGSQSQTIIGRPMVPDAAVHAVVEEHLILNKVLILGSQSQTIIGRPMVPDAAVHAVVEEHALDAKVIIFKKKRRKNYRRTKGHRQELTKLRIIDIQGIEKPVKVATAA